MNNTSAQGTGPTGETLDYTSIAQKFGFSPNTFFGHTGFIGLEYLSGPTGFYYEIPGLNTGIQFYFLNGPVASSPDSGPGSGPTGQGVTGQGVTRPLTGQGITGPLTGQGVTGQKDLFAGLTGFNASDFLQLSKDFNFKASTYFGSATGPSGSNYFETSKIIDLTRIHVEMYFKYTTLIEDVSSNSASLILMSEIDECLSKIKSERLMNIGTLQDYYEEIYSIINILNNIKLDLNLQSLEEVAQYADEINELLGSFNFRLETILEIITGDELDTSRQSLGSVLKMLEAYENLVCIIENQMIVRGQCLTTKLTAILDSVYLNIRNVFNHSPCVNALPAYMLCDDFSDIQHRIDKFEGYSARLNEFAQSLGLECLPPTDERPSFVDLLIHEKKYQSKNPCDKDI